MSSRALCWSHCLDQTLKQLVLQQQPRCWPESYLPLGPMLGQTQALGQRALPWCQGPSLCKALPSIIGYLKALKYLTGDTEGRFNPW